ncbi:LOW QUALITY PROTEIN: sensor histidine kinase, HAMP and PAS domain-containing [Geotalea daltonii FRC-32]|uniref:histidine kinase n=2 Tax=Geotalea TaxID=2910589 RepID=A0A068F6D9_GEODF|nr:LOW QUALITY PROTEIN: sensor histidine kinase, HAMP and PAS domain-containing [Geotalea daltonii FRC-32]
MKRTLEKRIILFSFLILFLTILVSAGLDIIGFRKDYINALFLRSQSLSASMKGSIEKVLNLGLDIRDIAGISEKCRELVDGNPDIAYCIITDLDGNILYLSDPKFQNLAIRGASRSYTSNPTVQINLVGKDPAFYDTVTIVKTADGKPTAQVHIGFEESIISAKVKGMILRSVFLLLVFLLFSFSLVVIFMKKSIIQPVSVLLKGVKQISEGGFDVRIQEVPVYEFNELAKNINVMSAYLKNRDEEIRKNYQELERTHSELHSSYLKLEHLSHELEKSEELYKSLMEDASDAIVVVGEDESVKMVNKMAEEFFGYSARELVGLPLTKMLLLLNIENIPKIHKIFKDASKGLHIAEEMQIVKKGGALVVSRLHASSIESGNDRLVQAIFRDVTKEREIMMNLEKSAADLVRLNKMKDSFLGLASHELKTPLTVIMGYAELITTDMADKVDHTVLEMVGNISSAAMRLDNIIKDMVDVSMIDEKRLQLKIDDVHVNQLVRDAVKELAFFFSMRKQKLTLQLDESIPTIKGDMFRLVQLFSNVLGNAIKFTPDGGEITVTTSAKYLLRSKQSADSVQGQSIVNIGKEHHLYVEIAVADTGIGIDREDQVRIFDKFYEAGNIEEHSTGKVAFKAKGAGLGLSIAKGIVDMHGGEIWVESPGYNSDSGSGSIFHILLPLNPLVGDSSLDYMNLLH